MTNNYLKLVRRLKFWVVVLAVLNIATISTIGVNMIKAKKSETAAAGTTQESFSSFFVNYLKLSDTQTYQFDSLYIVYSTSIQEVGIRMRDVKERLSVPNVENDAATMSDIYDDFIYAQSLNRDLTVEFYNKVRGICNPEQESTFNYFLSKIVIPEGSMGEYPPNQDDTL